jgi:hypothetical protein
MSSASEAAAPAAPVSRPFVQDGKLSEEVARMSAATIERAPTPRRFVLVGFQLPIDDHEALKDIAFRKRTTVARLLAKGVEDILASEGVPVSPDLAQVGRRPRGRPPSR